MKRAKLPTVAGILNIVSGSVWIIILLLLYLFAVVLAIGFGGSFSAKTGLHLGLRIALLSVPAIISIIGGTFALKRKHWGWALVGSICAIPFVLGLASTILAATSKEQFK